MSGLFLLERTREKARRHGDLLGSEIHKASWVTRTLTKCTGNGFAKLENFSSVIQAFLENIIPIAPAWSAIPRSTVHTHISENNRQNWRESLEKKRKEILSKTESWAMRKPITTRCELSKDGIVKRTLSYQLQNPQHPNFDPSFPVGFKLIDSAHAPTVWWRHEILAWIENRARIFGDQKAPEGGK